jgi:membrane protein required for colicin V production
MENYDIFMLVVLAAATVFGAWKGAVWQVASLASLVVSYLLALRFSERFAPLFGDHAPWNRFVAMLVIYLVSSMVIWLLFRVVSSWINQLHLKQFDHQLGMLLGAAKGVLFCVVITFFAITLSTDMRENILRSRSGKYIATLLDKADAVMPPELHEMLDPYLKKLEQELEPAAPESRTVRRRWQWQW